MSRNVFSLAASLLLMLVLSSLAHAAYRVDAVPDPRRSGNGLHVSDPDGQLADSARQEIESRLQALEQAGTAQVAVVVLKAIEGDDERRFANELFARWGIGDKQKDNGLLILLITESPRSITFETGYGLEGALPDVVCDRIIESMVPSLRSRQWDRALTMGVDGVVIRLNAEAVSAAPNGSSSSGRVDNLSFLDKLYIYLKYKWLTGDFSAIWLLPVLAWFVFKPHRLFPKRCPQCARRKLRRKGKRVLKSASKTSQGLARITRRCSACGYEEEEDETIPRITESSGFSGGRSRGSSSGRSSGRSSWGGGRSGGGGSSRRF